MSALPGNTSTDLMPLIDGAVVCAGRRRQDGVVPTHTHSCVEVALVVSGHGVHHSVAGRQPARVGDVVLLRPGVWHGYEECRHLDMYNCCFSAELLQHELSWTREDPLLGYLLWSGPYAGRRRGILAARLTPADLAECVGHLDALGALRTRSMRFFRGDVVGRLLLFLSALARAVIVDGGDVLAGVVHATHPAVVEAMRMMEERPARRWTLAELSGALHLAPGYLVRLFKAATGLPPIAYLTRHRVELAAARLLGTDEPIAHIGESVGWPDQNYFARRFRAHYGLSATAYRSRFTDNAVRLRTCDTTPSRGALEPVAPAVKRGRGR